MEKLAKGQRATLCAWHTVDGRARRPASRLAMLLTLVNIVRSWRATSVLKWAHVSRTELPYVLDGLSNWAVEIQLILRGS
jgi:hypothetical protein